MKPVSPLLLLSCLLFYGDSAKGEGHNGKICQERPRVEKPRFEKPQFEKRSRLASEIEKPKFEKPGFQLEKMSKPGFAKPEMEKPVFQRECFESWSKAALGQETYGAFPRETNRKWGRIKTEAHKLRINSAHQLKTRRPPVIR